MLIRKPYHSCYGILSISLACKRMSIQSQEYFLHVENTQVHYRTYESAGMLPKVTIVLKVRPSIVTKYVHKNPILDLIKNYCKTKSEIPIIMCIQI